MATSTYVAPRQASSLEDIFGKLADTQQKKYDTERAVGRGRRAAELSATNRFGSGIGEQVLGQYDKDTAAGKADIYAGVIPSIGQGTLQNLSQQFQSSENSASRDWQSSEAEKEYQRNLELAKLVGELNKPNTLSQIFQGIGSGGQLAGGIGTLAGAFA